MEAAEELGVESPYPQFFVIFGLIFLTVVEYSGVVDKVREMYFILYIN